MEDEADRARVESAKAARGTTLPSDVLELDHVYSALAHPRRRYLCYTLIEDTEWSLTELATKVTAWENDVDESSVTDDDRDRVYVSLYHAHVPKLDDLGVVDFDESSESISTAEHTEQVLMALRGMGASLDAIQEEHARREWHE